MEQDDRTLAENRTMTQAAEDVQRELDDLKALFEAMTHRAAVTDIPGIK